MSLKKTGAALWILVLIFGAVYIYKNANRPSDGGGEAVAIVDPNHDGREFADVSWKRLPHMQPFQLTSSKGEKFDSRSLNGKPYVISFFFTNCPTICRELNQQIARLTNRFKDTELSFLGLSVKPKEDTPEVLREYMTQFEAAEDRWELLTGQYYKIDQIARLQLSTILDGGHHTGDIFLIDRWGRFRDRFTWDDPREMKRFAEVAKQVLAEAEPPMDEIIQTRNVMASLSHDRRMASPAGIPWLYELQLTDQNGKAFNSRDLTGEVWVGSFFFSTCGSICPRQNAWLANMQPEFFGRKAKLVSISTRAKTDTPDVLRAYAKSLNAKGGWSFLTGDPEYIARIGSEFLKVASDGDHHASLLVVVDRWGSVRGKFDWQLEEDKVRMLDLIDQLNQEQTPVFDFEIMQPSETE